ncbi:MAG: phosphoglucosamine mutase [Tissierellia bacterium]|nr:phosphoglucosamine mutase [Tissierellia bacterium]
MGKYFGTDGVRGIAGTELTNELAYKLGRYGAYVITKHSPREKAKLILGKDTRVSSYMLESAMIAGILSVGCDVIQVGVIPTPGIAHLVKEEGFDGGIMVSASHNSYEYNGIKFFNEKGFKLTDQMEEEIESYITGERTIEEEFIGNAIGRIEERKELRAKYLSHAEELCHEDLNGLRILLDTAHGATHKLAPLAFKAKGAKVDVLFDAPNGININEMCGSTHLGTLSDRVVKGGYDLGFAFDGDGDRVLAIDNLGREVDGDAIMAICALDLLERGELKNESIVATVMSNLGFLDYMKKSGVDVVIAPVGDRYVLEKMLEGGQILGGEQSGHVILLHKNTTGDGIQTGLLLASALVKSGKSLSSWRDEIPKFPQYLTNAKVNREKQALYVELPRAQEKIKEIEDILGDKGRVLIRASGTEPLIRVMLEGPEEEMIRNLAEELKEIYLEELA